MKLLERIKARGFDRSYEMEDGYVKVRCSQCEALVVWGVATHESGCPNKALVEEVEDPEEEE